MASHNDAHELYLNVEQVAARFDVSTDTIYRWKRSGTFPKAVKLSPGCVRWRQSDLARYEGGLEACFAF